MPIPKKYPDYFGHFKDYRRPLIKKMKMYPPLLEETEFEETEVPTAKGSLVSYELWSNEYIRLYLIITI